MAKGNQPEWAALVFARRISALPARGCRRVRHKVVTYSEVLRTHGSATDVAKSAVGIVLTEPALGGIVASIREGRVTFQRILTHGPAISWSGGRNLRIGGRFRFRP